jgi:hypothetical protein
MRCETALAFFILSEIFGISTGDPADIVQKPIVVARLTLLTRTMHEDDRYEVRIEIENVSDHTVLVGRDLNVANNWPFRVEIQLEDSSGNQYGTGGADFLDNPPIADLSLKDNILKWWMPLEPHTFMGIYVHPKLAGVPPGKYRLHGTYVSFRPPSHPLTSAEQALIASKLQVFEGTVETNSIYIEVLPKAQRSRKSIQKK